MKKDKEPKETLEFEVLQDISISLGGVVATSAVYSKMLHARVVSTTDKAIRIQAYNPESLTEELSKFYCWLPIKALEQPKPLMAGMEPPSYYKLARWFRPTGFTLLFLQKYASIGGQTAQ